LSRIGKKINEERVKLGLTHKQLGKKCGVSESFIMEIETGKKIINDKMLEQLSKILGKNFEENTILETKIQEPIINQPSTKNIDMPVKARQDIQPLEQWEEALSGIIKCVPILDANLKETRKSRNFPIIDRKVEGYHPDKLVYMEIVDNQLEGFRIIKGDLVLIYLNHEITNNSLTLLEHSGKILLRKIKKLTGNKVELVSGNKDFSVQIVELKDLKVLGRAIRLEVNLNTV